MTSPLSLQEKVILVTGACGLIGKEISTHFIEQGAHVVLADINAQAGVSMMKELHAKFPIASFTFVSLDITDPESATKAVAATVVEFGQLDVLINLPDKVRDNRRQKPMS